MKPVQVDYYKIKRGFGLSFCTQLVYLKEDEPMNKETVTAALKSQFNEDLEGVQEFSFKEADLSYQMMQSWECQTEPIYADIIKKVSSLAEMVEKYAEQREAIMGIERDNQFLANRFNQNVVNIAKGIVREICGPDSENIQ